jgi:hypothetical protein
MPLRAASSARVVGLAPAVAAYLRSNGHWTQAINLHIAAAAAAQQLGNRVGQAGALNDLGIVRYLTDDHQGRPARCTRPWTSTATSATGSAWLTFSTI